MENDFIKKTWIDKQLLFGKNDNIDKNDQRIFFVHVSYVVKNHHLIPTRIYFVTQRSGLETEKWAVTS